MKGICIAAVALAAVVPAGYAKDKTANQAPVAWGMQSGQTGCVIFKESEEMTSDLVNGQMQSFTVKQLEVVEQQNAKLPHKKYSETADDLDALQKLSVANHLKFVKIPKKYTPDQLQQAGAMCKDGAAGQ
ncbi:MAG: hypothetical protein WCC14_17590 [Acidobacteriaceae bacterium]